MIIPVAVQMFKISARQIPNQNKAKYPNINTPFFQKNIQNELNYKGMYYLCTKI